MIEKIYFVKKKSEKEEILKKGDFYKNLNFLKIIYFQRI
jgi:hypothetical protein